MYNCNREYLSREELYGTRRKKEKNEIIRLMRHYKDSIPKPIKLNKDKSLDMRFKKIKNGTLILLLKKFKNARKKCQYTYKANSLIYNIIFKN